jgi:hypothetical protein
MPTKPSEANFIPEDAIQISNEEKKSIPQDRKEPPVDKYSGEKVSLESPSDSATRCGVVDDTVMPG